MADGNTSGAVDPVEHIATITRVEVEGLAPLHRKIVAETVLAYYVEGIPLATSLEGSDAPVVSLGAASRIVIAIDIVVADEPDLIRDCLTAVRHTAEHPDASSPER